jgi:hypothetical protein
MKTQVGSLALAFVNYCLLLLPNTHSLFIPLSLTSMQAATLPSVRQAGVAAADTSTEATAALAAAEEGLRRVKREEKALLLDADEALAEVSARAMKMRVDEQLVDDKIASADKRLKARCAKLDADAQTHRVAADAARRGNKQAHASLGSADVDAEVALRLTAAGDAENTGVAALERNIDVVISAIRNLTTKMLRTKSQQSPSPSPPPEE